MKNKKDYFKILMYMFLGALAGAAGMWAFILITNRLEGFTIFVDIGNWFVSHVFWIQLTLAVIIYLPIFVWLYRSHALIHSKRANLDDEAEDAFEDAFDSLLNKILIVNSGHFIISFVIFGIAIDSRNTFFWGSLSVFVVTAFLQSVAEIKAIRLQQKQDPMKQADPTASNFHEEYLSQCDEAEKLSIYEAGWKSFTFMQKAILMFFVVTLFVKDVLYTGNFPIFIVGFIWLSHSMSYFYHAIKNDQRRKSNVGNY